MSLLFFLFLGFTETASSQNAGQYVNQFIGTQGTVPGTSYNGGNVFPGATIPFGAVKVGIDTTEFNGSTDANAGYTPDGNVTAITMLHESGTGGAPKYGIIPQMPLTSLDGVNVLDNLTYMQPRSGDDVASLGYYKTTMINGVQAEMSASQHAGILQYTFPIASEKHVLVDLSHYLPTQDDHVPSQYYSNGRIDTSEDGSLYSGYGVYRGGWNEGPDYTVYFCAAFDKAPVSYQLFSGPYTDPYWPNATSAIATFVNGSSLTGGPSGYQYSDRIGSLFTFPSNASRVTSKVGVSWISTDKACQFMNDEIPTWDLNSTVSRASQAWQSTVFDLIQVADTSNTTRLEMFYSAMYRAHLLPSNRTGENPLWTSSHPYYDDFYTAWDTFRCLNSLYLLIEPDVAEGIVLSLIDIWKHEGFMPDGRSSNYNGRVQGGSNADNILADAYVKGLRGAINWTEGYSAVLTDANVVPYNNFDPQDLSGSTKEGRGALPDWLEYGYVTPTFGRSISRTVEYSLNDFSAYQISLGESPASAPLYLNRSAGWQRIWSATTSSLNYTGFLAPTFANGSLLPNNGSTYSPLSCGECEWTAISYEALPWEYSWSVPFDMSSLISLMGGSSFAESRLDTMFIPDLRSGSVGGGGNNGIGTTLFNPGNEPSFMTPFLYNYFGGGRQWKSVLRSRQIVDQYYNTGPSGLPGNSDAGALDSWLMWNMLGLYPVVAQPVYLVLAPWFGDVRVRVGVGGGNASTSMLRITAEGQGLDQGQKSYFVQSLKVNGKQWTKSWVEHTDLVREDGEEARLEFVLGTERVEWDTGAEASPPPSPGHFTI